MVRAYAHDTLDGAGFCIISPSQRSFLTSKVDRCAATYSTHAAKKCPKIAIGDVPSGLWDITQFSDSRPLFVLTERVSCCKLRFSSLLPSIPQDPRFDCLRSPTLCWRSWPRFFSEEHLLCDARHTPRCVFDCVFIDAPRPRVTRVEFCLFLPEQVAEKTTVVSVTHRIDLWHSWGPQKGKNLS